MAEIQSNYHAGSELCSDGINNITSTINRAVDQANCQCDSEIEKLTKTFVEGQPFHASDMNAFVDKLNEIIDALNGTTEQWEIADIVIYDNVEDTKIKSTADCFSLDKFPENRYTPIGIVTEVLEDGSAKIISLPEMSYKTPDVGTSKAEQLAIANEKVIETCNGVGYYDETLEQVVSVSTYSYFPTTADSYNGKMSKDGKRYYSTAGSDSLLPSPYNEDETINQHFFINECVVTFYAWVENSSQDRVVLTDSQDINDSTKIIFSNGNYILYLDNGDYSDSDKISLISGDTTTEYLRYCFSVDSFSNSYTRNNDLNISRTYRLANGDCSGKTNTIGILEHQVDLYFDTQHDGVMDRDKDFIDPSGHHNTRSMHFWYRINEDTQEKYYLFTTYDDFTTQEGDIPEHIADATQIWIQNESIDSFVYDYGCSQQPKNAQWIKVGTVGDENIISGGVEGFLSNFNRESIGPLFCWYRLYKTQLDETYYFLYTTDDEENITPNTEIWIIGDNSYSFTYDYGSKNYDKNSRFIKIGLIGDSTKINGGVEGFLNNFTRNEKVIWRTDSPLFNLRISGNFPKVATTWRFHTPGTEQGDWYLPSASEAAIAASNYHEIQNSLKKLVSSGIQGNVALFGGSGSGSYGLSTSTMYGDYGQNYVVDITSGSISSNDDMCGGYGTRAFTIISKLE